MSQIRYAGVWITAVLSLLVFFPIGVAYGQEPDPSDAFVQQEEGEGTWHDDVIRVKVSPEVADEAVPMQRNGVAMLGVSSIDALNQEYNASSIEPVFSVGGEYEERHREYGLHRWYEIRLEDGVAATDAGVENVVEAYGSAADVTVAEGKARAQLVGDVDRQARTQQATDPEPLINPPDDPLYDDQYGYENIEAEGGWTQQTGDTTLVVSIHDSGVELDHPDLFPNIWYGGDPDDGSVHGKNFSGAADDIQDTNGHGTHVTGTVAAATNNDLGVSGTAGGDGEFENGRGTGIRYMVTTPIGEEDSYIYAADNGAVISQNSWGYTSPGVFPQAMEDAIDYFIDNAGGDRLDGGLVVFAAGNDASSDEYFPGAYDPVVAVASTDENDNVSSFSNYGEWVDIAAPGTSILSTWLAGQGSVESNYEFLSGTSMAAPHVSGAAALVVEEFSGINSPDQVEATLEQAADDIGASVNIGAGRLNLAQALQEDDGEPPAAITDLSVPGVGAAHVDLEWTVPEGNPAVYDIRYSTDPIESDQDFENATPVEDPPSPLAPGETQTFTVEGLTPGTEHFFAIKSDDTFGNTSDLSNVASATTDEAPAIAVDPEEVDQTLNVGEEGSDMFEVLNEGVGTLEYSLQPAFGGSEVSDPISSPSAADADYPEGNYEPAMGLAPTDGEPVEGASTPRTLNADLEGTMYFGVNSGDETNFVSFEGSNPEVLEAVGSYPGSGFSNAGDFPRNDDSFVYELDNEGNLRTFDVETGEVEDLGDVGLTDVAGMSTDPTSGEIYVNTGTTLYTLDPDALETEEIGSFGVDLMIDIAVDGAGTMYGYSVSTNTLYEIDKETGDATAVGDIGFDANFGQGLTWDAENGVMIMAAFNNTSFQGELRTVNRETGNTELVGVIGEDTPGGTNQLGWVATPIQSTGEWLAADPTEGTIEAGNSDEIALSFQTTFEEEGVLDLTGGLDYFADVEVESNDPGTPTETVPVTLTVDGNPAVSVSDDPLDFGEVFTGTSSTEMLTIFNDSEDAILQVGSLELSGEAFTLEDDAGFVLDPGESMDLPITFEPTESTAYNGTLSFASSAGDQEVELTGQGAPFVSINPEELNQEIDLTTGDSTATQEFTVTNEFDESLPFIALIEALESQGDAIDLTPKLADEELRRWREMNQMEPQSNSDLEPSLQPAPEGGADSKDARAAAARIMSGPEILDEAGVTAFGNEILAPEIVSFDVGVPGDFTVVDEGVDSYAGNFTFANNDEVYWIDNTDNTLKTYVLEDGSVEEVGELEPEGSDVTWTDMETDPTTGTTYVTTGEGSTNRLYELDENTATLELVGEFGAGDLIVAFAIDDEGVGYAHDISNDQILEVDLENADAEALGSTGINANFAQSMTWDAETGQILMAALHDCSIFGCTSGTLRQVDRETGNTDLIGSFPDAGSDEMGWLATPGQGVSWLATNLEQGTLPAGASLTLEAEYDASDVVEGDYDAQISIVGEELQGQPSESLPVNLTVEAEPIAFVSKDSLGYGELFVNDTSSTQLVTLRNDGAANMNITDVSIDSDNFIFEGGSEFTLEPGDAKIFEVAFTPQSEDEFSATMSISGEEVSGEVVLTGEGIPAPELTVNPESFDKQAYLGQTQEETVEVSNTGGNPLEYNLAVLPSSPPAQSLLLEEGFGGGEFPPGDWFRAGANDGENWSTVGEDCGFYFDDPEQACFYWSPATEGTQRLITPQLNTEDAGQVFVQFSHIIDAFNEGEFTVRLETTGDGGETWTTVKEFPAQDVGPIDEMIAIDNEDVGSDEFHVAWTFEGDSFNINGWAVDDVQVFEGGKWLAVDKTSGTIAPSESDTLNLTVDTNVPGIEENTYESGLGFVTNDPLAKSSDLPFTLSVIESLTVTPEHDGNGEVNPNEGFTLNMNVESLDDLQVFSYEMEMGFNADRMQVDEVTTDGTLSDGLTLTSNIDNEQGTVTIAAADNGSQANTSGSGDGPGLFDIEGEGVLVTLEATGQPDHGEMVMDMQEMVFNEGEPPATAEEDTMSIVPLYGDVGLSLSVTADDAAETLDYAVGATDLSDAQKTHADVSGDGNVGAYDASLILQRTVASIGCFPVDPGCDSNSTALATQETSGESDRAGASFAWGEVSQRSSDSDDEGNLLSVPLTLKETDGSVQSIEVSTELDPDKVSVEAVEAQLPDGWQTTHEVSDDGTLRIALAGSTPLDRSGEVATVTLQQEDAGVETKMGGTVAVNDGASQKLESKSVVSVPDEFALEGTYPNPFSETATLEMQLPEKATVTVEVYDVLGRQVKTAHDGEMQAGAVRTVSINGSDLSTGTYFYRVTVEMGDDSRTESGRMTVVR